jgi:hypothetical protein
MAKSSWIRAAAAHLQRPRTWVIPYLVLWLIVGSIPITQTDLDLFFWPAADMAISGRPLMVYSAGGAKVYPDANGPVSLLPLTAAGLVANRFGWLNDVGKRRIIVMELFSVFILLMAFEGVAAIDRLRRKRVEGVPRLLAYGVLALAPTIWQSVSGYGHIEQPIEVWLLLVTTRWLARGWLVRAGITFGLAVLSRSPAALMAIPMALAAVRRGPARLAAFLGATTATGLAILAPFYLADAPDVVHSLFTYRGRLPVGAGSIWSVTTDPGAIAFIQRWDILFVVALALTANLWLATRPGGFTDERLIGGMALTAASFVLLAKTVWPYYFFEFYMLSTVWSFGRWRRADGFIRLILPPIAIASFGLLAEIGSTPDLEHRLVAITGGAMFLLVGITAFWLATGSRRAPERA